MATVESRPWGRARIRRDQYLLINRLLTEERSRVAKARLDWKTIEPSAAASMNRITSLIDATRDEFNRLADEMGWDLDGG